jgi:hypothetical protein
LSGDYPLVYLEWIDSRSVGRGWVVADQVESAPMTCHSVGWIYKDLDYSVIIVPHFADNPEQVNGGLEIPKCAITKQVDLRINNDTKPNQTIRKEVKSK